MFEPAHTVCLLPPHQLNSSIRHLLHGSPHDGALLKVPDDGFHGTGIHPTLVVDELPDVSLQLDNVGILSLQLNLLGKRDMSLSFVVRSSTYGCEY